MSALRAGVGQLLQHVALERRRVDDVVRADLRLEHREPVVVLGGDDDVLHARVLRELDPRVGVELDRVELRGELLVLLHRDLRAVHDPLAEAERALPLPLAGGNRVEAPVDEEAVLGLAEPVQPLFARRIRRRRVRRLRHPSRAARQGHRPEQRRNGAQFLERPTVEHANLRETRQKQALWYYPLTVKSMNPLEIKPPRQLNRPRRPCRACRCRSASRNSG